MDKRGFELAAGLIVILVASIIVFALAGTVTYKVLCTSEDKLDSYSQNQVQALEKRLSTGAAVVVADASKSAEQPSSICISSSSLGANYLIGVRNDGPNPSEIIADPIEVLLEPVGGGTPATSNTVTTRNVQSVPTGELKVGARGSIPVIVNLPSNAKPGRYIITMEVSDTNSSGLYRKVNLYLTLQ